MARFYKTADANPVIDYMYHANIPLMEKVLETNDAYVSQNLDQADKIGSYKYDYLPQDTEDAQGIMQGYNDKADAITNTILKDPANWRKQLTPIRKLRQDLVTNVTSGPISKQVANYTARKTAFDAVDKQVELWHTSGGEKGVDPTRADVYKRNWDSKFSGTGYNPDTGSYNTYEGGSIMDNINIKKVLSEGLDKLKADKTKEVHTDITGGGWYKDLVTNERVQITPEKILEAAGSNLTPQILQYLQQDKAVGLIDPSTDINPSNAYSYAPIGISKDEQDAIDQAKEQINKTKNQQTKQLLQSQLDTYTQGLSQRRQLQWGSNNYFTPLLRGMVGQYQQDDRTQEHVLSGNEVKIHLDSEAQSNYRQTRSLNQALAFHNQAVQTAADKLAYDKEQDQKAEEWKTKDYDEKVREFNALHPSLTPAGTKTTAAKSSKGVAALPQSLPAATTTVDNIATRSLAALKTTTPTGQQVPLFSMTGLGYNMQYSKEDQAALNMAINRIDEELKHTPTGSQRELVLIADKNDKEKKLLQVNSNLQKYRGFYTQATQAVLNPTDASKQKTGVDLDKHQIDLYNEFTRDRKDFDGTKFEKEIQQLKQKYPDILVYKGNNAEDNSKLTKVTYGQVLTDQYQESPQVQAARAKLAEYRKINGIVHKGADNFLTNVMKENFTSKALKLGTTDSESAANILLANAKGSQIFDDVGENGIPFKTSVFSKIVTAGQAKDKQLNFEGDNNLQSYMTNTGTKMNVLKVGNTTNLGTGNAVAEVTFTDPTGGINPNKHYFISMNNKQHADIVKAFKNHKDPNVTNVANLIGDDAGNSIRKQLMQPSIQEVLNSSGEEPVKSTLMLTNSGGGIVPLPVVASKTSEGTTNYDIFIPDEKGNNVPFPIVKVVNGQLVLDNSRKQGHFDSIDDFINQYNLQTR